MNNEMQHWVGRNRPPRVQITYDVEMLGATVKEEIPFIVGVIGDFAGSTQQAPIDKRTFVEIDRDSFEQVMQRLKPTLTLGPKPQITVTRTPDGTTYAPDPTAAASPTALNTFAVSLAFQKVKDFEPPAIIGQVGYLQGLMQTRKDLSDLTAKLGTTPSLDNDLRIAAATPALTPARNSLTTANTALTAATTGTTALFDKAAADVLKLETADPNKTAVTDAQTNVVNATGAFTPAFTAATGANPTAAVVKAAADALQDVVTALQGGISVLKGITDGYDATTASDDQKAAIADVKAASDGVDAFVPLAWQASLYLNSAAVAISAVPAA
ncbi:MAG TPA: type VI secretion system contractile sheath small subunit [Longimicrobium sp.]|jgi:type VI secretion system protein ImpB|nr:type VI secretion system contractile sheath small subunit [Longimicrobium sp.]